MRGSRLAVLVLLLGCGSSKPQGAGGIPGHGGAGGGSGAGGMGGEGGGIAGNSGHAGSTQAGGAGGGGAGGYGGAGATSSGGVGGDGAGGNGGSAGGNGSAGAPGSSLACALPAGIPAGGARCSSSNPCDPPRPTDGVCYGTPSINAATLSFSIWVEDSAAPAGGWRVTFTGGAPVTAGGHSYRDLQEGLVGTGGDGFYGDLYVARDGQAMWTGFHFEGFAAYQGGGTWDWPAKLTVSRAGATAPAMVGRHYTISRVGSGSGCNGGTYTFAADAPPIACAFGVDLVEIVIPGT